MKLGDPEVVGQLMRERRKALGFTIEQMAKVVGLSPITILRIEKGRVGYIHAKTAKALEVPKKITKRMVMVPVADTGEVIQPPAMMGDVMAIGPTSLHNTADTANYLKRHKNARMPKLGAKKEDVDVAGSKVPTLKRALLWLAKKM